MPATTFHSRRAFSIENPSIRVTVLEEGGHIAEILDKATGVSPLWIPPWASIEPSTYDRAKHPGYGTDSESKLLAGIMGHNLCMDIFGGTSDEEAAAGRTVHGEASIARYTIEGGADSLRMRAQFPIAQFAFERQIRLAGGNVEIRESVENLSAADHPTAWTQHVTLGPPFLEKGRTEFRASATRAKVVENDFSGGKGYMKIGVDFDWPNVPRIGGGHVDLRVYTNAPVSAGYTTPTDGPASRHRLLHGVFADRAPGVRLRMAARRFSLARNLGRKLQPDHSAVERPHIDARHGIWGVALSGAAPANDRAGRPVRHAGLSLDSGEVARRNPLLGRDRASRARTRGSGVERRRCHPLRLTRR